MKSIELLRWSMKMTDEALAHLVEEMREAPLTQPTSRGGNHPLWVVGHLAVLEGSIPGILLGAEGGENPVEHWRPLFGTGTEAKPDGGLYPAFDEVLSKFRALRQRNLSLLERFGEAGLDDRPKAVPPGFEDAMISVGHTYLLLCLHQMVHYGQVADARRAAGLKPLV